MVMKKVHIPVALALAMASNTAVNGYVVLTSGDWTVDIDDSSKAMMMSRAGVEIFKNVSASSTFQIGGGEEITLSTGDVTPEIEVSDVTDIFGTGQQLALTYAKNGARMVQTLRFYTGLPYFIAQINVSADNGDIVRSNRMLPFYIGETIAPMGGTNNRILWVPFDNDGHVDYKNTTIGANSTHTSESHEVGCVHNVDSRFGLIAGSVDHDTWKNGVIISGKYTNRIERFECLSGMSNYYTRDVLPHGKVKGQTVSSARFMVGAFDDWREGLDAFAEANTVVAPPAEWPDGNPVGWSSWGSQQDNVSYDGVMESARFMKDELFNLGFHDSQERITISLDSFGEDNIAAGRLATMAAKAFGNGTTYSYGGKTYEGMNMVLGLYGGQFCIWEWYFGGKVKGTGLNGEPSYTFDEMALKVNGEPYRLGSNGAYASDPTHPAMRAYIRQTMKDYAARGAKYLKIDFMNCGIVQGDSYYDPEVTTAVQAYNYGMKIIKEEADKYGMYLVLAMSPAFPYQYTHGRRTCCDRFSEIGESEYVMNATSYGFWMDKLYPVCDPDQMVLCKNDANLRETEGENRARATTGMTTGAFIFGDNFSDKVLKDGVVCGYPEEAMRRAKFIMGNPDINAYVRENTGSFRPVEGKGEYKVPNTSETIFVRHTPQYSYVAVFNFSSYQGYTGDVTFERLGLNPEHAGDIKELWFGSEIKHNGNELHYDVPVKDARVYRITNLQYSGVDAVESDGRGISPEESLDIFLGADGGCNIKSPKRIRAAKVYGVDGCLLGAVAGEDNNEVSMPVAGSPAVAVVHVAFTDGDTAVRKVARSLR